MPRDPNRCPTHPGALLREDLLPATGLGKAEAARRLGISRQHLYDLLNEKKPMTPEVAVRVARLFGGEPEALVRMQGAHDTWKAVRSVDVSHIVPLHAA